MAVCLLTWASMSGAWEQERVTAPMLAPLNAVVIEGRVESRSGIRNLAFGRSGRLSEVTVQPGEKVQRGQLLARLACAEVKEDLLLAEAELRFYRESYTRLRAGPTALDLDIAHERLLLAQADLATATVSRDRLQSLFEQNGFVPKQDIEAAERRMIAARLEVAIHQQVHERTRLLVETGNESEEAAGLEVRAAAARRARHALSMCDIHAPMDAVVTALLLRPGEGVSATSAVMAVVSDDPGTRGVAAWLPVSDRVPVKIGQELRVRIPAAGSDVFKAKVSYIAPLITTAKVAKSSSLDARQEISIWIDVPKAPATVPLHAPAYVDVIP